MAFDKVNRAFVRSNKGSLTQKPEPPKWSREEWAAKHGGRPVADVVCLFKRDFGPGHGTKHVHARRAPEVIFEIDPKTGRWIRPAGVDA